MAEGQTKSEVQPCIESASQHEAEETVGRGTSVLGAGENTRWHIQCVGFFGKRLSPGLIKCSDKNRSFIKVCSHSGSARPRSWNVSWKPASLAEECCLSYLIRRSCCERSVKEKSAGRRGEEGKPGSSPPASWPKPRTEPSGPRGFAPDINPAHVGGKAHRGFQESKQGQLLSQQLPSLPSSTPPALALLAIPQLSRCLILNKTFSLLCLFCVGLLRARSQS